MKIETPYRLTPEVERYFHEAGKGRPDARGEVLRSIHEPLDIKRIEAVLTPGYKSMLRDTIALTHIHGGIAVNAMPSHAMCEIDIRLLPGSTADAMIERVKEAVGKNGEVEVLLKGEPVPPSPTNTELYRALAKVFTDAEPGSRGGDRRRRNFRQPLLSRARHRRRTASRRSR